jgi:hypothetical protein
MEAFLHRRKTSIEEKPPYSYPTANVILFSVGGLPFKFVSSEIYSKGNWQMQTNNQECILDVAKSRSATSFNQECTIQNTWRMRWFFAIVLTIGFLASLTIGIVAFLLTQNPYTLAIVPTPTILMCAIASHLFPTNGKRFRLTIFCKKIRIHIHLE